LYLSIILIVKIKYPKLEKIVIKFITLDSSEVIMELSVGIIILVAVVVIFLFIILPFIKAAIKILPEYERAIVLRLGKFVNVRGPGLIWIIPGIDKIIKVDLRINVYDARTIKIITKDNIRADVDSFVYYRVIDPKLAILQVKNYVAATQNLAKTVLRDVLGGAELDGILSQSAELTLAIQKEIDEKSDGWGIKVSDVAISDVILPVEMQRAIAKQAEAERERRARIIIAQGEATAAKKMLEAAKVYEKSPITLKLREFQTLYDIAREKNLIVVTSSTNVKEIGEIIALSNSKKI
jgi:regulator of protease activity HflC (stomatin/prohibitin superfamily)